MNKKMTPEELEKFIHRELRALPIRKAPAGFEARLQAAVEARTTVRTPSAEQLEQFIHTTLRSLPNRRAPGTLEARVLAEVERRATIAWYHKSWSYWPAPVRAAFLAVGTAVAGAAVIGFYLLSQGATAEAVTQEVATGFGWVTRLLAAGTWTVNFVQQLIANIPPLWLYGGLAFIAAMYATFVGLGTAAYRYLYRNN
jgi:anti-sigma factor RsiW